MSDDDDAVVYQARSQKVHYGSLEETERRRLAHGGDGKVKMALRDGIKAGHINIADGKHTTFL